MSLNQPLKIRETDKTVWDALWQQVDQPNLFQSWQYGSAKSVTSGWEVKRFVVEAEMEKPVAIFQLLYKRWWVIGGVGRINRGPLLLNKNATNPEYADFYLHVLKATLDFCHNLNLRIVFVSPELSQLSETERLKSQLRLRPRNIEPWGSSILDLECDLEKLSDNLKGKWRNLLRKSNRSETVIYKPTCSLAIDELRKNYKISQKERNYKGIPDELLFELSSQNCKNWQFKVYKATDGALDQYQKMTGMLVTIISGNIATYFIAFSNESGRRLNVNYQLLWNAIEDAREIGCKWFDMGGLNDNTPSGVAHFKRGVRGEEYKLVGEYYSFRLVHYAN